jgi:hypothetical protein
MVDSASSQRPFLFRAIRAVMTPNATKIVAMLHRNHEPAVHGGGIRIVAVETQQIRRTTVTRVVSGLATCILR